MQAEKYLDEAESAGQDLLRKSPIVHGKLETHHYRRLLMTVCYARFARIFLERAAKRASQLT